MSKCVHEAYVKLGLVVPSGMLTPLWKPVLAQIPSLEVFFD